MAARTAIGLAALVLSGCAGDSTSVPESALATVVLQPADLPSSFERFDEGRQVSADQPEGRRADAGRFGRRGGWKSRFRRRGDSETRGPLVVESRADLFDSSGGADDELDAIAGERAAETSDRGVGDESLVVSTTQPGLPRPLRTVVVTWRSANVVGAITASGFQGRLSDTDVIRLARLQQARIAAASE